MDIIGTLTGIVVALQLGFIVRICSIYFSARGKIITPDTFKQRLNAFLDDESFDGKDDKKNTWIKNLSWTIGRQTSLHEVKDIIRSEVDKACNNIRMFSNLGPAVGLFFTFLGLMITLVDISRSGQDIIIKDAIGGLYPVLVGSALGILVYGVGNIFARISLGMLHDNEEHYLGIFLDADNKYRRLRISNLEDIYENLIEPVTEVVNKFEKVGRNFSNFSEALEENIKSHQENSANYINAIKSQVTELKNSFSTLSADLSKNSQEHIISAEKLFADFRNSFKVDIQKHSNHISGYLAKVQSHISDYLSKMEEKFNSIKESLLAFSSSQLDVSKSLFDEVNSSFATNIQNHNQSFQGYIDNIGGKIQTYLDQMEGNITNIKNSYDSFTKDVYDRLEKNLDISNQLFNKVENYQKTFSTSLEAMNEFTKSNKNIHDASKKMEATITEYLRNVKVLRDVGSNIGEQTAVMKDLSVFYDKNTLKTHQFLEFLDGVKKDIVIIKDDTVKPLLVLADKLKKFPSDMFKNVVDETKAINDNLNRLPNNIVNNALENKKIKRLIENSLKTTTAQSARRSNWNPTTGQTRVNKGTQGPQEQEKENPPGPAPKGFGGRVKTAFTRIIDGIRGK